MCKYVILAHALNKFLLFHVSWSMYAGFRVPWFFLFQMLSLPHLCYVVMKCGLKHFVCLTAFGRSSNHRMCFWLPVYHGHKEKIYQLDKLTYQPSCWDIVINERKFLSSSLQWGRDSNYWYHSPRKHQWGVEHSKRLTCCQVSMCKAEKEAI